MKEIKLTQGKVALVDDIDFEMLIQYKWYAFKHGATFYAGTNIITNRKKKTVLMHRLILDLSESQIGDHEDRNGLNNLRSNLRVATKSQNCANRKSSANSTSKYLGVYWNGYSKKWRAQITHSYKVKYLGYYTNENNAALAYNNAAKKIHGEFANLNKVA